MVNIKEIKDFDSMSMTDGKLALQAAYNTLEENGIVSFTLLSWNWLVGAYGQGGILDKSLSTLLFKPGRCSIWNELTIVKTMLDIGFAKVWTGHLPSQHESILGVKAIKSSGGFDV